MAVPRSGPSSVYKGLHIDAAIATGRGGSHIRPEGHDRNHARGLSVDHAEARPDGKGGCLLAVLDRLKAMRGPGESYGDVISRLGLLPSSRWPRRFARLCRCNSLGLR